MSFQKKQNGHRATKYCCVPADGRCCTAAAHLVTCIQSSCGVPPVKSKVTKLFQKRSSAIFALFKTICHSKKSKTGTVLQNIAASQQMDAAAPQTRTWYLAYKLPAVCLQLRARLQNYSKNVVPPSLHCLKRFVIPKNKPKRAPCYTILLRLSRWKLLLCSRAPGTLHTIFQRCASS